MEFFLPGYIQYIEESLHIQVPGQTRVFLAGGRKDRCQQVDLGDILTDHLYMQHFFIHHIQGYIGTRAFQQRVLFPKVGSDHIGIPVQFTKGHSQFHPYLTGGTYDQDFLFYHSKRLEDKDEGSFFKFQLKKQIRELRFIFAA